MRPSRNAQLYARFRRIVEIAAVGGTATCGAASGLDILGVDGDATGAGGGTHVHASSSGGRGPGALSGPFSDATGFPSTSDIMSTGDRPSGPFTTTGDITSNGGFSSTSALDGSGGFTSTSSFDTTGGFTSVATGGFSGTGGGVGGAACTPDAGGPAVFQCFRSEGRPCAAGDLADVAGQYSFQVCARESITDVFCGPFVRGRECCYVISVGPPPGCYVGRAFLAEEGLVKAEVRRGTGWRHGAPPDVRELSAATRAALHEDWLLDALFEHASVASFARFSLEMLLVGAPPELIRATHAAASDEVRHAELCFALASAYAGEPLEPAPFPIPESFAVKRDLGAIAAESAIEGCIGETLAAAQAMAQLERATDPAVRAALEATVADEIRHAELSWRFVAWAIDHGGAAARDAVRDAFRDFVPPVGRVSTMEGVNRDHFAAHGRLTATEGRAIAESALAEVIRPCACALLSRPAAKPGRATSSAMTQLAS